MELHRLLTARLLVARAGEFDALRWWPTEGVLAEDGAFVGGRVLPRTHWSGRARIAFAAARVACEERYPAETANHLFWMGPQMEDRFDLYLGQMKGETEAWEALFEPLEGVRTLANLESALRAAGVVTDDLLERLRAAPLGPGGRSLDLTGAAEDTIACLAGGVLRGLERELVVPYTVELDDV